MQHLLWKSVTKLLKHTDGNIENKIIHCTYNRLKTDLKKTVKWRMYIQCSLSQHLSLTTLPPHLLLKKVTASAQHSEWHLFVCSGIFAVKSQTVMIKDKLLYPAHQDIFHNVLTGNHNLKSVMLLKQLHYSVNYYTTMKCPKGTAQTDGMFLFNCGFALGQKKWHVLVNWCQSNLRLQDGRKSFNRS